MPCPERRRSYWQGAQQRLQLWAAELLIQAPRAGFLEPISDPESVPDTLQPMRFPGRVTWLLRAAHRCPRQPLERATIAVVTNRSDFLDTQGAGAIAVKGLALARQAGRFTTFVK